MDNLLNHGGDESCFLFNLTENLRFDTVKVKDGVYTSTKQGGEHLDDTEDGKRNLSKNSSRLNSELITLKFGETSLEIKVRIIWFLIVF